MSNQGSNHYSEDRALPPFAMVLIWLVIVGLDVLGVRAMLSRGALTPYLVFAVIFTISFLLLALAMGYRYTVASHQVTVTEDRLIGIGAFGQRKEIAFDTIDTIVELADLRVVGISPGLLIGGHTASKTRIVVNAGLRGFGEMTEQVLERSPNCTDVRLTRLSADSSIWQKEPARQLIEAAMARADANRQERAGRQ